MNIHIRVYKIMLRRLNLIQIHSSRRINSKLNFSNYLLPKRFYSAENAAPPPTEVKEPILPPEPDNSFTHKPYKSSIEIKGIVFDKIGNVKLINEAWKKSDLCANFSVFPRDLRKVISLFEFNSI